MLLQIASPYFSKVNQEQQKRRKNFESLLNIISEYIKAFKKIKMYC